MNNPSAQSSFEPRQLFPRTRAFTLVELLVVLVAVVVLAALMVPILARSRNTGSRTVCTNNLRQMGLAVNMFASDNQDYLAYPNWGVGVPGWLYGSASVIPDPTSSLYQTNLTAAYQSGFWFQYIRDPKSYFCPVDLDSLFYAQRANKLSSYVMNGAVCAFAGLRPCKVTDVWNPACYLLWEPDENELGYGNPGAFQFNDGANSPDATEGLGRLHTVNGGELLTVGGNVQFVSWPQFTAQSTYLSTPQQPRGLAWWSPFTFEGH